MNRIAGWWGHLSKRIRDSILISSSFIGFISIVCTILGVSLNDLGDISICMRVAILVVVFLLVCIGIYDFLGKDSIELNIRQTEVTIAQGDIFSAPGLRVIGCDTCYDIRIDDVVISKSSLHGKLFLEHGDIHGIRRVVEAEAQRLELKQNSDGLYEFPLGTIICYNSVKDGQTYLMLALSKLNENYEAHTNTAEFVCMLMKLWKELSRVYAGKEIVLPLLGRGILRFDGGSQSNNELLKCILFTLRFSGVHFTSKIKILMPDKSSDVLLYEYKDLFN